MLKYRADAGHASPIKETVRGSLLFLGDRAVSRWALCHGLGRNIECRHQHRLDLLSTGSDLHPRLREPQIALGDPAGLVGTPGLRVSYDMALGDAHTIILPIGPTYLLSIGPHPNHLPVPRARVDELNTPQTRAAGRYVYTRPGSPCAPSSSARSPDATSLTRSTPTRRGCAGRNSFGPRLGP